MDQADPGHRDAMHDLAEGAARAGLGLGGGRLPPPLPQELAVAVEHRDAPVAVAVRDVDVAVAGIDREAGRVVELREALVQADAVDALAGAVLRIELAPGA